MMKGAHMNTGILEKERSRSIEDFYYQSFNDLPLYDQRYIPRWKTTKRAYFRIKNERVIYSTQIKDLSLSGVCLYASPEAQVGQPVELKIYLSEETGFIVEGTIIWERKSGDNRVCAGVAFKMLTQPVQDLILQYAFDTISYDVEMMRG